VSLLLVALVFVRSDRLFWDEALIPKLVVFRALLLLVAVRITRRLWAGASRPPQALLILGGAFLVWSLISSVASDVPRISLLGEAYRYEGFAAFAGYFLLFFYGWMEGRRSGPNAIRSGFRVLALVAAGVGLVALSQQLSPDAASPFTADGPPRSWGTFGNPLYLALFGCLFVPLLTVAAGMQEMKRITRALCGLGGGLLLVATAVSYSRAGWLALPLGCLVVAALLWPGPPRRLLAGAVGATVILALVIGMVAASGGAGDNGRLGRMSELWSGEGTVGTRVEMYRGAAELIADQPLAGWGFGTYGIEATRVRTERLVSIEGSNSYPDRPHSSLLYVAYSTGLPGALLYGLFLLVSLGMLLRRARRTGGRTRLIAAGGLAGVIAYLLAELTVFSTIEVTPLMFPLLGWLLGFADIKEAGEEQNADTGMDRVLARHQVPVLRAAAAALVPLFFLMSASHAVAVGVADATYNRVLARADGMDFLASAGDAALASRLEPYVAEYWNIQAALYRDAGERLNQPALLAKSAAILGGGLQRLPSHPLLVVSLTDVLVKQGDFAGAVALAERHLRLDPYSADTYFNKGTAHIGLRQFDLAAASFERSVQINPRDPEALLYLGSVYEELGLEGAANRARERVQELDAGQKGSDG
jgi:O-antigen ligase